LVLVDHYKKEKKKRKEEKGRKEGRRKGRKKGRGEGKGQGHKQLWLSLLSYFIFFVCPPPSRTSLG